MKLRDDPHAEIRPCSYLLEGEAFRQYGPTLAVERVYFTCPVHGPPCLLSVAFHRGEPFEFKARIDDKTTTKVWKATGEFPDSFTLEPSVHVHAYDLVGITNGEAKTHWHGHVWSGEPK